MKTSNIHSSAVSLIANLKRAKQELIASKKILDKKDNHVYPLKNIPFNIPESWEWVYLSDVSIIQEGPGIRKNQYQEEGIQFLTVTNILEGSVDLNKSKKYISLIEYGQKYRHYTINFGDIVTACSGASWGKSAIYNFNETLILNTSTLRLRFFNDIADNSYLYYLTKSSYFKTNLSSHLTGQQPNYGYSHYSIIPIPIPPLSEQKEIVAILDTAFEAIDQAKANIEKNIANAKELFQSKLNGIFSQKGEGWEEKRLGDIIEYDKTQNNKQIRPYVGLENIESNTGTYLGNLEPQEVKSSTFQFDNRHVLYGRLRPYLNKVLVPNFDGHCSTEIFPILPNKTLSREFLFYWLMSPSIVKKIDSTWTGARMPRANMNEVLNFSIWTPSIENQLRITSEIDELKENLKELEKQYVIKLNSITELKKSLLQKAFAGELMQKEMAV